MTKAKGNTPEWSVREYRIVGGKPKRPEIGGGWVQADGSIHVKFKTLPSGEYLDLIPNPYWKPKSQTDKLVAGNAELKNEAAAVIDPNAGVVETTKKSRRTILKRRP